MSSESPGSPGRLSRFVEAGRVRGHALRGRRDPIGGGATWSLRELHAQLDAAGERATSSRIWEREIGLSSLRGIVRTLSELPAPYEEIRTELEARVQELFAESLEIDETELADLRRRLASGDIDRGELKRIIDERPVLERDAFIERLLWIHVPPVAARAASFELVRYVATPYEDVLRLIDGLEPDDVVEDLGCGLGKVPLLVALLGRGRARGVEYDAAYAAVLRERAETYRLSIDVIEGDAREHDYGTGTVFYLHEPFRGAVLDEVMARMREGIAGRPGVRLVTRGATTDAFRAADWLEPIDRDAGVLTWFSPARA